jgi:multidrug efflux pump subunit AcrA (membrane-fusion protein)
MAESAYEQPNPSDTRRLKATAQKVLIVLVIVAILIAIIGVASRLISRSHLKKRTADDAQMTVVTTKPDSSGADNELVLPGNVSAFMEAPIYARTNGYLKVWYTDIGARVHKGQRRSRRPKSTDSLPRRARTSIPPSPTRTWH